MAAVGTRCVWLVHGARATTRQPLPRTAALAARLPFQLSRYKSSVHTRAWCATVSTPADSLRARALQHRAISAGRASKDRAPPRRRRRASVRQAPSHTRDSEVLYGVHAVEAALRLRSRGAPLRLFALRDAAADSAVRRVAKIAAAQGIPVESTSRDRINAVAQSATSQGVALVVKRVHTTDVHGPQDLESIATNAWRSHGLPPVVLALDQVVDPQHLGAMLRTAAFLGVDAVITSVRNSAPFSPAVAKVSCGALEVLAQRRALLHAHQMPKLLSQCRAAEPSWQVVGTGLPGKSMRGAPPLRSLSDDQHDRALPTILVMGNEAAGLRTTVFQSCTHVLTIPSFGTGELDVGPDSLSVSASCAILLYHMCASRRADASRNIDSRDGE